MSFNKNFYKRFRFTCLDEEDTGWIKSLFLSHVSVDKRNTLVRKEFSPLLKNISNSTNINCIKLCKHNKYTNDLQDTYKSSSILITFLLFLRMRGMTLLFNNTFRLMRTGSSLRNPFSIKENYFSTSVPNFVGHSRDHSHQRVSVSSLERPRLAQQTRQTDV